MEITKNLWVIGLSHWKTPVEVREKFTLSKDAIVQLIESAKKLGINSIFPISTCNRTEIYATVERPEILIELLSDVTGQKKEELTKFLYTKNSEEAVTHLFNITAGLDSQILGDAQITGQVREFLQITLQHDTIDAPLNRLIEQALKTGKKIKAYLQLNNGASSIAHAAVKQALALKTPHENAKTLIIGSGKMGKLTVKSLLKFISPRNIKAINRTNENVKLLAKEFRVRTADYSLKAEILKADFIFVATSSSHPIVTNALLKNENLSNKIFIDLSLPRNIEPSLPATVISIDKLVDSDKQKKESYLRLAEQLILEGVHEYYDWLYRYELAQNIKSEIHDTIFDNSLEDSGISSQSKFVDGITSKYLRHFKKDKQSRNLAA